MSNLKPIDVEEMIAALDSDFAQECLLEAVRCSKHFEGRDEMIERLQEIENNTVVGSAE